MTAAAAALAAHTVLAGHTVLAASQSTANEVTPGVLGFLVVAGMGAALVFLLKSMNRQLKKIPPPPLDDEDGEMGPAKPLSPLQAAAARRRAFAAQKSAGQGPDLPDRLG